MTMNPNVTKAFFSTAELAEYLGISVSCVIAHRVFGTGPAYKKIGRLCRYRISDVEKWIAEKNYEDLSLSEVSD